MSIEEIEALLQIARKNIDLPVDDQELGPGDLQHFRGFSGTQSTSAAGPTNWQLPIEDQESLRNSGITDTSPEAIEVHSETCVTSARPFQFTRMTDQSEARTSLARGLTLEDLGDVDLDITIELGRSELLIEDVLKLREGSVVSLDKLAGDPVDIIANGRLIARGELLVVDGKFAVRLSEVL